MSVWGSPKASAEEPLSRLSRAEHTATAVVETEQTRTHSGLPTEAKNPATTEAVLAESDGQTLTDRASEVLMLRAPLDGWARTEELAQAIVSLGDIRRDLGAMPIDLVAERIMEALDAEFRLIRRILADQIGDKSVAVDAHSPERDRVLERLRWLLAVLDRPGGAASSSLAKITRTLDPPSALV